MKSVVAMVLAGVALGAAGAERVVFEDPLKGKLADGWSWLRENPKTWRIGEAGLEIRAEPGDANSVRNALLRPCPDRSKGKYAIELTVSNATVPTNQYEQAGITLYSNDRPVFKFVKELVDGKLMMIPGRKLMDAQSVQLRLVILADSFIAMYRPDGKGQFLEAERGKLAAPGKDQVSIQCYHGPPGAEHWIRFSDFRIIELTD